MIKTTIEPSEFIRTLPDDLRANMEKLDKEINTLMTGHPRILWTAKFWGGSEQNIIGYGDY
ncbi:MAG: hypothetical protein AB7Q37_10970 [Pyrinomonadaceae bacterium]